MASKADQESTTNTRPYGSDNGTNTDKNVNVKTSGNNLSAREYSERNIVERHGEAIRNNPQWDELVKEDMRQVEENRKATEGM